MFASTENKPKTIVLLHDLSGTVDHFRRMQLVLKWCFPDASILVPRASSTLLHTIDQQAAYTFAQLCDTYGVNAEEPLVLIGHSQGGLRGHALLRNFGDKLNIKGLITLSTPWEGAPVIACAPEALQDFLSLLRKSKLPALIQAAKRFKDTSALPLSATYMADALEKLYERTKAAEHLGILDMKPGSDFLHTTAQHMGVNTTPILALAGGPSNLVGALLPRMSKPAQHIMNRLQRKYMESIVPIIGAADHDLVVPVYSQVAQNIAPQGVSIVRQTIAGAIHSHAPGIQFKNAITEHPTALARIIDFVEHC